MNSWLPPGLIFVFGAALIPFLKGKMKQVYLLALPLIAFTMLLQMTKGKHFAFKYLGYELVFGRVDKLSMAFGYIFVIMSLVGVIYSIHLKEKGEHIAAFLYLGSALGVVFAGDFLTLYIFWEIMAVASTFIILGRKTKEALQAGYRYILVHIFGGLLLFAGIIMQISNTGSLEFDFVGLRGLPSLLILLGFTLNAAVPPLSAWLSDAYPEATVTGAVFLSAYTTKTAVYVLIRGFHGIEILIWAGAIMAFYGVVYAVLVNDIRRILAYHIISQVGFMVAGVGLGTALAINGAVAHAFSHIMYKGLLFMGAGAVLYETGESRLSELGGLNKKMPITLTLYMIGALSISAFPLFSGFVSKSMVIAAAGEEHLIWIWGLLTISSAGTFLHTGLKLPWFTWFGKDSGLEAKEPPSNMLIAMGIAAFVCILIGVYPAVLYNLLPFEVDFVPYTATHVVWQLQYLLFTGLGFFMLLKYLEGHRYVILDTDWFYIKAGPRLQLVAEGFNRLNLGYEAATTGILSVILWFKKPIAGINAFASRLIFAVFVDMWLFRPVTPTVFELKKEEKEAEALAGAPVAEEKAERTRPGINDFLISIIAALGERLSQFSGLFDRYVIDGIVNAIGWITLRAGKRLRPIQTGDVQNYGFMMVAGAIVIVFAFALAFYGFLRFL